MKTYKAGPHKDFALHAEFMRIEQASQRADPFLLLQYLHAEPAKMRAGMIVLADGTDWDPGSGAGLYRRSEDNASWILV